MEDNIFKSDAKSIVDAAFNSRLFKDELTRDDFNAFEDIIEFMLKSRFEGYQKTEKLLKSIDEYNKKKS